MVEFKLTNGYSLMLTTEANEQAKKEREAKQAEEAEPTKATTEAFEPVTEPEATEQEPVTGMPKGKRSRKRDKYWTWKG